MNCSPAQLVGLAAVLAAGWLASSGCKTVGPDYQPPRAATPANWTSALQGGLTGAAAATNQLERWWTAFNDPVLADLIERARTGNLDLRQAEARVREARAQRGMAQAALSPALGANASARRTTASKEAGSGQTTEFHAMSLDASWELDLFGGKRRALESAAASWQAAQENLRDVQVSLLAEVALTYVELRSDQELLSITESNVLIRTETYDLTRWRHEAGLTTQLDEDQARQSLEQVRAQVPSWRTSLAQANYRLALLLGQPPGALQALLAEPKPVPATPSEVAVGVPADLLRRRPDVRSAERQLAAQTAQIGVAKAQRYPNFSLSGTLGLEALEYADLYSTGARAAQGLAKAAWTILDGGSIRQNIALQTAKQQAALSLYESTVLTALKDVESALVAYANEQARRAALAAAVKAGQSAFELARTQYSSGLASFQTVLDTQQSLLTAQDELAVSQAKVTANLISLYKALGGGWIPSPAIAAAPPQTAASP